MRLLKVNEIPITIFAKYFDYIDVFSLTYTVELLKHTSINNYIIKLKESKSPFYSLIYSLGLIKLKLLKTYIKIILANGFIKSFKLLARVIIFFNHKFN